jgi:hypothetical protein
MSLWLQWGIVMLLVSGSLLFALWRLLPVVWRVRLQVRFGWRVGASAGGCAACPAQGVQHASLSPSVHGQRGRTGDR